MHAGSPKLTGPFAGPMHDLIFWRTGLRKDSHVGQAIDCLEDGIISDMKDAVTSLIDRHTNCASWQFSAQGRFSFACGALLTHLLTQRTRQSCSVA